MKRKKRSGTKVAFFALAFALSLQAAKKRSVPETYALVAGTVFSAGGYALPDAEVSLTPDPQADSPALKVRKLQTVSDPRGEFVFRVPAGAMHYLVTVVSVRGFRGAQKAVDVQGEERVDITFLLDRDSK